jgi:hypothetical protein
MKQAMRTWCGFVVALLSIWGGAVAVSHASDIEADVEQKEGAGTASLDAGISPDGGDSTGEAAAMPREAATSPDTALTKQMSDNERPAVRKKEEKPNKRWRLDKSVPRRPGSFMGGSSGVAMAYAWYTTEQQDLELTFDLGPIWASAMSIRVGDAFFEWFTVGFQINFISGGFGGEDDPKTAGFALFLDTAFYPWRGLGLRPSVGLGFSYAQAGTESYQISFGGPATLGFAVSYEFRVTRLFTMGPSIQFTWTTGDEYDCAYLIFALEFIKWFKSAKG